MVQTDRMDKHYLAPLFTPGSVVVFAGRTDAVENQSPQARMLRQALEADRYTGTLHFVDIHTSGTLKDLAQTRADLAIIALAPTEIAAALEIAARIGCRTALVLSTGIGTEQAAELSKTARREGVHLLGPNSLGFQRPQLHLNASTAGPLAKAGQLALVSQSGALTASMLDWARKNSVGFSNVVSLGPHTSVDLAEVLDFFAHDGSTHSIIVYMEGISNARRFMSALRSASHVKPVVVEGGPQASGQRSGANAQRLDRR